MMKIAGVFLFGLGFFACVLLVEWTCPISNHVLINFKIDELKKNANRYNTIVLGNSYVHRQIVPAILERGFNDKSTVAKVYNFGIPGLSNREAVFLIEKLYSIRELKIKALVLELSCFFPAVEDKKTPTERNLYWRTTQTFLRDLPDWQSAEEIMRELRIYLYRAINYGRLKWLMKDWEDNHSKLDRLITNAGFFALDWEKEEHYLARHRKFVEQNIVDKQAAVSAQTPLSLTEAIQMASSFGSKSYIFKNPHLSGEITNPCAGFLPAQCQYLETTHFPKKNDADLRFDGDHFNYQGAFEFSKFLGQAIHDL